MKRILFGVVGFSAERMAADAADFAHRMEQRKKREASGGKIPGRKLIEPSRERYESKGDGPALVSGLCSPSSARDALAAYQKAGAVAWAVDFTEDPRGLRL